MPCYETGFGKVCTEDHYTTMPVGGRYPTTLAEVGPWIDEQVERSKNERLAEIQAAETSALDALSAADRQAENAFLSFFTGAKVPGENPSAGGDGWKIYDPSKYLPQGVPRLPEEKPFWPWLLAGFVIFMALRRKK